MDFEEFEKCEGKTPTRKSNNTSTSSTSSCCNPAPVREANAGAFGYDPYDHWGEWDMADYGPGGGASRDYFGFHLPHNRTGNEKID